MKKILPVLFLIFYLVHSNGQAVGGWGTCEFATIATMSAFDPSTNAYDCKKVFVQATNEHYRWDGTQWVKDNSENIYNTDGTLDANRTVDLNGSTLTFKGADDVIIEADGDVGIGTPTPAAKFDVANGTIRFSDYGGGTITGTETNILAVDSDGDVIETAATNASGTGALDNIYVSDGTLQANRTVTMDGRNLTFNGTGTGNVIIQSDGDVGIGTTTPTNAKLQVNTTGSAIHIDTESNDRSAMTIRRTDNNNEIGIAFQNSGNFHGSTIFHRSQSNTDGLAGGLSIASVGNVASANDLGVTATFKDDGTIRLHDYGVANNQDNSPAYILGVQADGDIVEVDGSAFNDNIYNTNGTLTTNRTVTMDGRNLTFDGVSDVIIQNDGDVGIGVTNPTSAKLQVNTTGADGGIHIDAESEDRSAMTIRRTDNTDEVGIAFQSSGSHTSTIFQRAQSDANGLGNALSIASIGNSGDPNLIEETATFKNDGTIRLHDYGVANNQDNSPAYILGVQTDGDIVEVDGDAFNDNIYNIDGTLQANRTVTMDGRNLTFNGTGTGNVIIQSDGDVGIGTTTPTNAKLQVDATGTNSAVHIDTDHADRSLLTLRRTNNLHEIGLAFQNSGNAHGSAIFHRSQTDAILPEALTIASVGINSDVNLLGATTTFKTSGDIRLHNYGIGSFDEASPTRLLGVQADGDVVEVNISDIDDDNNIYNTDGTLQANRTVTMSGRNLTFNGTGDVVIQDDGDVGIGTTNPSSARLQVDATGTNSGLHINTASDDRSAMTIRRTNNSNEIGIAFQNSGNAHGSAIFHRSQSDGDGLDEGLSIASIGNQTNANDLGVTATFKDDGTVRLHDYGLANNQDNSPAYILGVQADGDIVEVDASTLNTDNNIYNTNGTLTANRTVTMSGRNLTFDGTGDVVIQDDGDVGIGVTDPTYAKLQVNATGTSGGIHIDTESEDRSAMTIRRTNNDNQVGMAFQNSGGFHGSAIFHNPQDDPVLPEALTIASIGNEENANDLGATATFKDDGTIRLHDYGVANNQDNSPAYILGVQTDGDVVEVSANSLDDNLGNHVAEENIQTTDYWISNDGDDEGIYVQTNGNVGIGTDNPNALLSVGNGKVIFEDYGSGSNNNGSDTYMLSVDANGNVQEMNTAKSARVFYPPSVAINASTTGPGTTNLYTEYQNLFTNPVVRCPDATGIPIPSYNANELLYYITDYDTSVFSNVAVSNTGVLTYTVDSVPTDNCSFMNVVFVVK